MTESQKGQATKPDDNFSMMPIDFEAYAKLGQSGMEAMGSWYGDFLRNVVSFNQEVTSFISMRLNEDIEYPAKLLACHTPEELAKICTKHFETAYRQYAEESEKLTKMSADIASQTMKMTEELTNQAQTANGGRSNKT